MKIEFSFFYLGVFYLHKYGVISLIGRCSLLAVALPANRVVPVQMETVEIVHAEERYQFLYELCPS